MFEIHAHHLWFFLEINVIINGMYVTKKKQSIRRNNCKIVEKTVKYKASPISYHLAHSLQNYLAICPYKMYYTALFKNVWTTPFCCKYLRSTRKTPLVVINTYGPEGVSIKR